MNSVSSLVVMLSSTHIDNSAGYLEMYVAPMMAGKCFAEGTKLLRDDGTSVEVQDLKKGDKLMGDDGKSSRTVLSTTTGRGKMYTIFSDYSEPLTVNEDHVLVLRTESSSGKPSVVFETTVRDYLDTPLRKVRGYRIFTSEYDLPYQTNMDKYPVLNDCYGAGRKINTLLLNDTLFFLNNALRVRRYFFAGILDEFASTSYHISISLLSLSSGILDIVRKIAQSLGFYVRVHEGSMYFEGDFTRLPSENSNLYNKKDAVSNSGCRFWIESAGEEEQSYYGFVVDENSRFLTADCFVTHNTTEILRKLSTISRTKKCLYINHESDTRSDSDFSTHNPLFRSEIPNIDMKRVPLLSCSSILTILDKYSIVAVDEAQFFPDLIESVRIFVEEYGKYVIVAGLSGDINRKPFGQILNLIPLADSIQMLASFCENCARDDRTTPAPFTVLRKRSDLTSTTVANKNSDGNVVQIGGAESYEPVCRECYLLLNQK